MRATNANPALLVLMLTQTVVEHTRGLYSINHHFEAHYV